MKDPWSPVAGGVTAPAGFQASGVAVGLKPSGALDLAVVVAPPGASCAGVFTRNQVRAACVDLCAERLRRTGGQARAVVVNAGQANACTGDLARAESERITTALARRLDLPPEQVQICSTGVIGQPLPVERLLAGQAPLVAELAATEVAAAAAAEAILTTDLVSKQYALEAQIGGRLVRLGGMAKGSGMIHPDMATMLAFLTCDAGVDPRWWQQALHTAVACSFNAVTVDGDTSTNDTVLAFAAGAPLPTEHLPQLALGLERLCRGLAKAVARDGEGATCLLQVQVSGTATAAEARTVARTVCSSSLVKTAIHGRDPNWGRIVAAAGAGRGAPGSRRHGPPDRPPPVAQGRSAGGGGSGRRAALSTGAGQRRLLAGRLRGDPLGGGHGSSVRVCLGLRSLTGVRSHQCPLHHLSGPPPPGEAPPLAAVRPGGGVPGSPWDPWWPASPSPWDFT